MVNVYIIHNIDQLKEISFVTTDDGFITNLKDL